MATIINHEQIIIDSLFATEKQSIDQSNLSLLDMTFYDSDKLHHGLQDSTDVLTMLHSHMGKQVKAIIHDKIEERILERREQKHHIQELQQEELRKLGMLLLAMMEEKERKQHIRDFNTEAGQHSVEIQQQQATLTKEQYDSQVDAYDAQIDSLNNEIAATQQEINSLAKKITVIQQKIDFLIQQQQISSETFAAPENNFTDLFDDLDNINLERLDELEARIQELDDEASKQESSTAQIINATKDKPDPDLVKDNIFSINHKKNALNHVKEQRDLFLGLTALRVSTNKLQHQEQDLAQDIRRAPTIFIPSYQREVSVDTLLHAFTLNGEACNSHEDADLLLKLGKDLYQDSNGDLHYAKKAAFYFEDQQELQQAFDDGQIYMLDKDKQLTFDVNEAVNFNYVPRDHKVALDDKGHYQVYDASDKATPLEQFAHEHSKERFNKKRDDLLPIKKGVAHHFEEQMIQSRSEMNETSELHSQKQSELQFLNLCLKDVTNLKTNLMTNNPQHQAAPPQQSTQTNNDSLLATMDTSRTCKPKPQSTNRDDLENLDLNQLAQRLKDNPNLISQFVQRLENYQGLCETASEMRDELKGLLDNKTTLTPEDHMKAIELTDNLDREMNNHRIGFTN